MTPCFGDACSDVATVTSQGRGFACVPFPSPQLAFLYELAGIPSYPFPPSHPLLVVARQTIPFPSTSRRSNQASTLCAFCDCRRIQKMQQSQQYAKQQQQQQRQVPIQTPGTHPAGRVALLSPAPIVLFLPYPLSFRRPRSRKTHPHNPKDTQQPRQTKGDN